MIRPPTCCHSSNRQHEFYVSGFNSKWNNGILSSPIVCVFRVFPCVCVEILAIKTPVSLNNSFQSNNKGYCLHEMSMQLCSPHACFRTLTKEWRRSWSIATLCLRHDRKIGLVLEISCARLKQLHSSARYSAYYWRKYCWEQRKSGMHWHCPHNILHPWRISLKNWNCETRAFNIE